MPVSEDITPLVPNSAKRLKPNEIGGTNSGRVIIKRKNFLKRILMQVKHKEHNKEIGTTKITVRVELKNELPKATHISEEFNARSNVFEFTKPSRQLRG